MKFLMKGVLFFSLVSSCSVDRVSSFLIRKETCGKKEKFLHEKSRQSFFKTAELCLKENKIKKAVFILERLFEKDGVTGVKLKDRKALAKKLAKISFYQLKDYNKALKYYDFLLKAPLEPGEKFSIQYSIAQSFYYLEKFSQALIEIEKCFFEGISMEERKQAVLLKAWVLLLKLNLIRPAPCLKKRWKNTLIIKIFLENLWLLFMSRKRNFYWPFKNWKE